MEPVHTIAGAPKVAVPIRIRGMSADQRYFDEETQATRITEDFIVAGISYLVDLEIEVHVTNPITQAGGTYRVAWVNRHDESGNFAMGLELIDSEGAIWDPGSILRSQNPPMEPQPVELECSRCHRRVTITIPEADPEEMGAGFSVARPCDICKATTAWRFGIEEAQAAPGSPLKERNGPIEEQRAKGRVPLQLMIRVTRKTYGMTVTDICETINISRTGVYFTTDKCFEVGDMLEIVVPYHPDSVALPVPARVVRREDIPGTFRRRIAVHLNP
jgi:hypothetical protein